MRSSVLAQLETVTELSQHHSIITMRSYRHSTIMNSVRTFLEAALVVTRPKSLHMTITHLFAASRFIHQKSKVFHDVAPPPAFQIYQSASSRARALLSFALIWESFCYRLRTNCDFLSNLRFILLQGQDQNDPQSDFHHPLLGWHYSRYDFDKFVAFTIKFDQFSFKLWWVSKMKCGNE